MATAIMRNEMDEEVSALVPEETESTALVLREVVAIQKITDSATYVRVVAAGTDAASNMKSIESVFKPICEQRHARWRRATELRAEKLKPFEEIKKKASELIGAYERDQERTRRAEEERLQAEQQKLAEAEAKRKADEQAIADAEVLAAEGDHKGAEAVLNNPVPVPVYVPPVILQKSVPKVAGKSSVTTWEWRVRKSANCNAPDPHETEKCSVCLAEVPREYLILDTKMIGQLVRAMKEKTAIPGIEPYPSSGARFRG